MATSEVAELRRRIELEIEAMQRGLNGFAIGTARHEFIRRRMDRVGVYQGELVREVGEDAANGMVFTIYAEKMEA
ncbi:MAG: hypothetical protein WCD86_19470 [Ktedonobacteraceae bacterium]